MTYEIHPAANLFPMMHEDELGELADDILSNGLLEPISLYEQKIIDGRNRYRACEIAGIDPAFRVIESLESPVMYVVSKNLH